MAKFRKRPVVVEAEQFTRENIDAACLFADVKVVAETGEDVGEGIVLAMLLPVRGSAQQVNEGDWLIRGLDGELYPCSSDIFEATYERVE